MEQIMYDYGKQHIFGEIWQLGSSREAIFKFSKTARIFMRDRLRDMPGAIEIGSLDFFQAIDMAKLTVHQRLWDMGYRSLGLANYTTWHIDQELWAMLIQSLPGCHGLVFPWSDVPAPLLSHTFNKYSKERQSYEEEQKIRAEAARKERRERWAARTPKN